MTILGRALTGLILAAVMVPCASAAAPLSKPASFSAREIFEGIVLQQGPVAVLASTAQTDPKRVMPAVAIARQKFILSLEKSMVKVDHTYFADFANDMTSGDPGRVSQALRRTNLDLEKIANYKESRKRYFSSDVALGIVTAQVAVGIKNVQLATINFLPVIDVGLIIASEDLASRNRYYNEKAIALLCERLYGHAAIRLESRPPV